MKRIIDFIIFEICMADVDATLCKLLGKLFKGQLFFFTKIFQPLFCQRHPCFVIQHEFILLSVYKL
ncbi:hypothetical protein BACCAP_02508 [Pseudoflavonifractor capillosus ATCC 29799]|uniref:Uncharacterized protein n=1 Tax=Pseudoflavonifractor capillosus ATCC 29799 TaxID=411467 RepID=A6NWB5_9FIRM|nr:hypothetical protein BACCAP_02508 [Pseudoflavonifractor capillosus ATCC 29799]